MMNATHVSLRLLCSLTLSLLFFAGGASAAQQIPSGGTLKVKTQEVLLDVVVTDRSGHLVTNLERDDFRLYEDGVEQKIRGFMPPSAHGEPDDVTVHSSADLKKIGNAPVTILVLDELNTPFEDSAYAREALEKYLQQQPPKLTQPTTLMVANDHKTDILVDFTQDRDLLIAAVKHHMPALAYLMEKGGNSGTEANERMIRGLGALMQIAESSEGSPGRKNVIWVGDGFPAINTDLTEINAKRADELNDAVKNATQLLLRARVTVNLINPSGMKTSVMDPSQPDITTPQDILNDAQASNGDLFPGDINFSDFALATGGSVYQLRNDVRAGIANAIETSSKYYTLTYSPTNKSEDPAALRKIRILMRDPNLVANTRTGYYVVPERPADVKPAAPDIHRLAFDLTAAALSMVPYSGLDVRALKNGDHYDLIIPIKSLATWTGPDGTESVELTVMVASFDAHKHVLGHTSVELAAAVPTDGPPNFRFKVPVTIPNRASRVRFVARDVIDGKIGTADVSMP